MAPVKFTKCARPVLQLNDFKFLVNNGHPQIIKIIITAFKHNTDRKPFEISIDRENTLPFCPVKSLVEKSKLRGALPWPLFCQQNLTPITVYQFNTEVSRCLQFCGLDTTRYKGHSFRIGAASLAIKFSQMRKSALLAAGNLMLSNYISALNASKPIKLNISIGHALSKHLTFFSISVFYFSPASEM